MDELCIVWFGSICMILREALSSFHWRSQDSFKSDQIYQISKRVLFLAAGHTNLTDIIFATKKSVKILWSLWHLSLAANYHRRTRTVGFADNAYRGHPSASGRQKSVLIVLSAARKNVVWIDLEDFARSASLSIGFAKNRTNLIKSIKSLSQLFMLSLLLESPTTITTYTIFLCQILSSIVQVCR